MSHISYFKKTWSDNPSSGTTLDAASLNNIENGIANSVNKINSIDDKIAEVDKIFCGSVVRSIDSSGTAEVFSENDFEYYFGRGFNPRYDCVVVSNGDYYMLHYSLESPSFIPGSSGIATRVVGNYDGVERKVRINFIVMLGNVNYD